MLKVMIFFMIVCLSLEATPHLILKTGQIQGFDANIQDDVYYQVGLKRSYTRNDIAETVTDNTTELEWQDDDAVTTNNQNWTDANNYCSTLKGGTGWRLPSKEELESIVDRGKSSSSINDLFNNVVPSDYWSSTAYANDSNRMWYLFFGCGSSNHTNKTSSIYVRCVRGEQLNNLTLTRDSTTKIVTDSINNLRWQDNSDANSSSKSFEDAIEYCESLFMSGQTDWRLPNIDELLSIVDSSRSGYLAVNNQFVYVSPYYYWSSTSSASSPGQAWNIRFAYGSSEYIGKSNNFGVRCVRGGQFYNLKLKALVKTEQVKSYDESGSEVTDGSVKDDGYYRSGIKRNYTRNDTTEIVTDNVTKLEWQDDSDANSIEKTWTEAKSYCSALNLNEVAGWRLPSIEELRSIVDMERYDSPISDIFNNVFSSQYWSSTPNIKASDKSWYVSFSSGGSSNYFDRSHNSNVRCVRDGTLDTINFTRDDTANIVTDGVTNLQWQDDSVVRTTRKSWIEAIGYCEALEMAGQTDWRLPNENELLSIVDSSRDNPAMNNKFVNFSLYFGYWSSTTSTKSHSKAWNLNFSNGSYFYSYKTNESHIRCVRGGEVDNKITITSIIMYLLN